MCGRFMLRATVARLTDRFGLRAAHLHDLTPRYNIAPGQSVLAVGPTERGRPGAAFLRWGLVPAWAGNQRNPFPTARAETVADKGTFAAALRHRRCLIPADGYYEWSGTRRRRRAWRIRLRGDDLFAFAGIWESRRDPTGRPLLTCAILTVPANDLLRPIQPRMPAILTPEDYGAWTDRTRDDPEQVLPLLCPYPADAMEALPVGPYVNDARHEGPRCLEPPGPSDDDPYSPGELWPELAAGAGATAR